MRKFAKIMLAMIACWHFLLPAGFAFSLGPLSQYCQTVLARLKPIGQFLPPSDQPVVIQFCVDNYGRITNMQLPTQQTGYTNGQRIAWQQILVLKRVDPPPPQAICPLWLSVSLFNQQDKSVVSLCDLDWEPYTTELDRRVKRNWHPPKSAESKSITVSFKVLPDGNIRHLAISKSSGMPMMDQSALDAVQSSVPFPLPPDGCSGSPTYQFTLDYNVTHKDRFEQESQSY